VPIYEYKCRDCGKTSEFRITSQSQVNGLACSVCGSQSLNRLFSVPSITSGRKESYGQTCCGSNEGCSEPGRCCNHQAG
jgi:putative FmdB family regulatory protein